MVAQGVKAGCGILMPMMSASLDQVSQPLPELDVLLRAPPIQAALHAIHERNILHNDLKPANILIAPDGKCFWLPLMSYESSHLLDSLRTTLPLLWELMSAPSLVAECRSHMTLVS